MTLSIPKVVDHDRDEITVEVNGVEIRSWSYATADERRVKMQQAHEFVEGYWHGQGQPLKRVKRDPPPT